MAVPVPVAEEVAVAEEVELALFGVPVGRPVAAGVRLPTLGEGVAEDVVEPVGLLEGLPLIVGEGLVLPVPLWGEEVGKEEVEGEAVDVREGGGLQ